MNTPICDFVKKYNSENKFRLHMPGHKGNGFLGIENLDITEIEGADVLYNSNGIIAESQKNTSLLFDTKKTLYSTEGSSLSIRAMLYLAFVFAKSKGKKPFIAAGRNAHKSFLTAAAVLDIDIDWLYPEKEGNYLSFDISAEQLDYYLKKNNPSAVYLTSPDYLGNILDIKALSEVCKKHGVLLIVDNAHGAYLKFLPESLHPISLGADMCCDSAHKTLPVLTGGSYLHISKNAPEELSDMAEKAFSLFASTSPSYLILQSLDYANYYIANGYRERLKSYIDKISELKNNLKINGYSIIGKEPLKLTIEAKKYGYTGIELAKILSDEIICEFYDPDYLVMMLTPENGEDVLKIIEETLLNIPKKEKINAKPTALSKPIKRISPREALFSLGKDLPVKDCKGLVLSSPTVSCPPAIPIVVCGEEIDENAIELFKYYGIKDCNVIDLYN